MKYVKDLSCGKQFVEHILKKNQKQTKDPQCALNVKETERVMPRGKAGGFIQKYEIKSNKMIAGALHLFVQIP